MKKIALIVMNFFVITQVQAVLDPVQRFVLVDNTIDVSFLKNNPMQSLDLGVLQELLSNPTVVKFIQRINSPNTTQANANFFKSVVKKMYQAIVLDQQMQNMVNYLNSMMESEQNLTMDENQHPMM